MSEMMRTFSGLEMFFAICAIIGGVIFIARMILQIIGHHTDIGGDGHFDAGGHDVAHGGDSDVSFKLITFHGVAAFFLMLGLVGLALTRQSKVDETWAVLGAFMAGMLSLYVVARIYTLMGKIQSSGTLDMRNAIGQEGSIYLRIPVGGTGKAQVTVQNRLQIFDAVTNETLQEIKTGERVRVVDVNGSTLIVEKAV